MAKTVNTFFLQISLDTNLKAICRRTKKPLFGRRGDLPSWQARKGAKRKNWPPNSEIIFELRNHADDAEAATKSCLIFVVRT